MNILLDLRVLSVLAGLLAGFQLFPVLLALAFEESPTALLQSMLVSGSLSAVGLYVTRKTSTQLRPRDGYLVVSAGWYLAAVLGGLPYVFHGGMGWVDAFFETASGFTTTGSTVMTDIEVWPQSILLWRSITQWLGGMGILVMAVAILPFLGIGSTQLIRAEVPGPTKDRMTPRMIDTARILWGVYVGITLFSVGMFMLCGMNWLEAIDHSFTAIATGGFSTRNLSLAAFSPAAQWWSVVVMAMGGMNFLIHYRFFIRRDTAVFKYEEFLGYLAIIGFFSLYICLVLLRETSLDWEESLRHATFQVVSIMTTTGFASIDWEQWPGGLQLMLGALMVIGGMSGSTGGGIKVVRGLIIIKTIQNVTTRLLHPHQILSLKMDDVPISREFIENCIAMLILAIGVVMTTGMVLNAMGVDLLTAMGAALTCWANVGPGFANVGAMDNFSQIPTLGKAMLASVMIVGRLEIFTVLMLFSSRFWRY
ncbi:MAG: TrkH family potassium uptake protein [Magnetococcales bacterium]|nr:TrkH family potassium uptake protein [Magnetococcales bacterium]